MNILTPAKAPYHTDDSWWHLLSGADGSLYLLVNCEASFISYDCLIKLNDRELLDYHGLGWLSLQHLANQVNYFSDEFKHRRITGSELEAALKVTHKYDRHIT